MSLMVEMLAEISVFTAIQCDFSDSKRVASGVLYLTKKHLLQLLCWMKHPLKWTDNSSLQTNSEKNVDFSNQLGDTLKKAMHPRRVYQQRFKTQNPICQFLHRFTGCHMYVNAR